MIIKLPVTWECCGVIEVEADSIENAIEYFDYHSDELPLPDDFEYVDASFQLSCNEPEYVKSFQ